MGWSVDDVVALITLCVTIPTFILAVLGIVQCYRRRRRRLSDRPGSLDERLFQLDRMPLKATTALSASQERDQEMGWIEFNHVTMMARAGSIRFEQRPDQRR
ncbi:hypothetical protein BJX68DRAFT_230905 [Aspergillus pseudodeflectus]|uniref:Uncharacterized protein n=1 Tax=Aspergillus pseudodeflectus TaxID=176178 RepID=A0ABR4KUY9_9EURO